MPSRGKRLTLIIASLAVIVLGVATWQAWRQWPQIVFRWRLEALGANAAGYQEYRHRQTGIVFVRVPGGTFNMGSPDKEPGHLGDESPLHEAALSPFLIGKCPVTQGQWRAVMGSCPSLFDGAKDADDNPVNSPDDRDRLPVESVSWDEIQEFEAKTGLRLPTEAQWEYSCRAGTGTAFSFGSGEACADWDCAPCPEFDEHMWYCSNSGGRTHEVGGKSANPFGLYDAHGNVWEWCEDVYNASYYSYPESSDMDPLCTWGSDHRVFRGGSWDNDASSSRSARRERATPSERIGFLGFRAACYPLPD